MNIVTVRTQANSVILPKPIKLTSLYTKLFQKVSQRLSPSKRYYCTTYYLCSTLKYGRKVNNISWVMDVGNYLCNFGVYS